MKNVLASFSFLLLFSLTGNAQTSAKKIPVNFIDDISFTPAGSSHSEIKSESFKVQEVSNDLSSAEAIEKSTSIQFKYAMLLDVDVESLSNILLYNFIEEWFGTRYRMGGDTKKGIDCSAFTETLLQNVYALPVPRTAKEQYNLCSHINRENLMEGDFVFFNTKGGVSHVGVYLSNGHFVHSSGSQGVMISNLDDKYFSKRFICGGRLN